MLKVNNLTVNYRHTWALQGVSFQLQPGQLTGLFGPNGAGKSTLVKGMMGLIPGVKGEITFNSKPLLKQLKRVAYVPQRTQIDWNYPITVEKVVMMGRIPSTGWFKNPGKRSHYLVRQALERVGMWQYRQHRIGELSGGQQQRVFLAKAIAQQADLYFFDEPFNNIDRQTEGIIFEIFAELKAQQKTLLVISHDLSQTINYYDYILLLNKQLIASGSLTKVFTNENINKTYGHYSFPVNIPSIIQTQTAKPCYSIG